MLRKNESGMLMVEMTIYFPIIFLVWLMFIFTSLLVTQRVVLDRAVARAATQGASWLSNSIRPFDEYDPFVGGYTLIRTNPYVNTIAGFRNPFHPSNESDFKSEIETRVRNYARGLVSGISGEITIDIQYRNYFGIAGDLTVTAQQEMRLPINLRIIGIQMDRFTHTASATARVINHGRALNNIHFAFDLVRHMSGNSLDIRALRDFVADAPENASDWIRDLTQENSD